MRLPGHSAGSIGFLLADGDFICGDLLANGLRGPAINDIMDDRAAARAALTMLQGHEIRAVCSGHGQSFSMESFLSAR